MQDEEYVRTQILMKLGLTLIQAKTYTTLAKMGAAGVQKVSKNSSIARSEVYRVLPTLEKIGLVERILTVPTVYRAIPVKDTLQKLLENKKNQYTEIEQQINSLSRAFEDDAKKFCEWDPQFKITSEWTLLKKMHKNLIESTQTSIDTIIPIKNQQKLFDDLGLYLRAALKRGVKIRSIIQTTNNPPSKKLYGSMKKYSTEIKFSPNTDLFGMHIFDKMGITYNVSAGDGIPAFWSNDSNTVRIAEGYFESLWSTCKEGSCDKAEQN